MNIMDKDRAQVVVTAPITDGNLAYLRDLFLDTTDEVPSGFEIMGQLFDTIREVGEGVDQRTATRASHTLLACEGLSLVSSGCIAERLSTLNALAPILGAPPQFEFDVQTLLHPERLGSVVNVESTPLPEGGLVIALEAVAEVLLRTLGDFIERLDIVVWQMHPNRFTDGSTFTEWLEARRQDTIGRGRRS